MSSPSKEIYLETTVDAGVKDVWYVWTTEEGMKTFFAPESKIEMKVGGAYEMYFLLENEYGQKGGEGNKVLAIEPEKLLRFTWNAPPQYPEIRKHKTLVTLKFYSLGDNRTKVTLSHTGWGEGEEWDEVYNYFVSAWGDVVLPNLKKVVSSQK